jgi:hypothetical protein
MFLNSTFSGIEADAHRQALLDQAAHHRLVKLVRRAARAGTRVTTPPAPPPTVLPEQVPRNHDENRRYAVSR